MEAYIVPDRTIPKGQANKHIVMLARNKQGYQNLLKLHYEAYKSGASQVYDRIVPRMDHTMFTRDACKGIIATTACLVSEVAQHLIELDSAPDDWEENFDEAERIIKLYKQTFDGVFAEIQPDHFLIGHDPDSGPSKALQVEYNDKLRFLAKKLELPLTVATDSHYLTAEEREAHHLILAIQSKKNMNDPERFCFESTPMLTTEQLLSRNFGDTALDESVVKNTTKIADACEYPDYLSFQGYRLPKFPIPQSDEYKKWLKTSGGLLDEV